MLNYQPQELTEEDEQQEQQMREAFKRISGGDMEIDAYELQDVLNNAFLKGIVSFTTPTVYDGQLLCSDKFLVIPLSVISATLHPSSVIYVSVLEFVVIAVHLVPGLTESLFKIFCFEPAITNILHPFISHILARLSLISHPFYIIPWIFFQFFAFLHCEFFF